MSTNTNTNTEAEATPVAAFYAQVAQDAEAITKAETIDDLRALYATQEGREGTAARLVGIAALASWQARGEIILRAFNIMRPGAKVTQKGATEVANAADGLGVSAVSQAQVGRYLEAVEAKVRDLLVDIDDALGTDAGPASGKVTDLLRWCKVKREIKVGSNANAAPIVTQADAKVAEATRKAEAKARAEAVKATQEANVRKVTRAKAETRLGLVTARQVREAIAAQDVALFETTIAMCEAGLARIAEAKAVAKAKAEADAAKAKGSVKAEADDLVSAAQAEAEALRQELADLRAMIEAK